MEEHTIGHRAVTLVRTSGITQDKKLSHAGQDAVMLSYAKDKGLHIVQSFYELASGLDANTRREFLDTIDFVLDPANNISHLISSHLS